MALKPWIKVIDPREDLREGRPLDASEFAVHLDKVSDGSAPEVYSEPRQFFDRTFLTRSLTELSAEVVRRLSGEQTETSAVFNMATQFGGGKTHALALLFHLARGGAEARQWAGVPGILARAGVSNAPKAATAVFVGTEFDSVVGRIVPGEPTRRTPWGEIAFQLGGVAAYQLVAEHDEQGVAPGGDVIRALLPAGRPTLILLDELMNYVSRNRKSGLGTQFYYFLQNLSEVARSSPNVVLAASIPASEMEMTEDDHADYDRFKKVLDRLGKAIMMSQETEVSEIIRRRLFDWDAGQISADGRVMLSRDAKATCAEYADWVLEHRQQLPSWFPLDNARETFEATYPFHPMALSVFERKWQSLPRFQRTRGVLRLLALWVSKAWEQGGKKAHQDPLIGLGTAPLDDAMFRSAMFEQLGEDRWEAPITTDICKANSHAVRLDEGAVEAVKKARLHRKTATAIFFESNGGQTSADAAATLPELRLSVLEPGMDVGHIESVLESLSSQCYYLSSEKNRYRFSLSPNLNKLLADRRAGVPSQRIEARVREEIERVLTREQGIEVVFFPEKSSQIVDRTALTFVVLPPDQEAGEAGTMRLIENMTRECGGSARRFKSALIWCVADASKTLHDDARKLLALDDIRLNEYSNLNSDQQDQIGIEQPKARRDLKEAVWRAYRHIVLLDKNNELLALDLGPQHSSAHESLLKIILARLEQDDYVASSVSANLLLRNWPPAFVEWNTKSLRDAFYASPQFPRVTNANVLRRTIERGVAEKRLAYVGKSGDVYQPFEFGPDSRLQTAEIEWSDETFIIPAEVAEAYLRSSQVKSENPITAPKTVEVEDRDDEIKYFEPNTSQAGALEALEKFEEDSNSNPVALVHQLSWQGGLPSQKWMNFYTKVLTRHSKNGEMKLTVKVELNATTGLSPQQIEEMKSALRELGLNDQIILE